MSEYLEQAKDFLKSTGTSLEYTVIGELMPPWSDENQKPVKTLNVTIKNDKHTYNFNFYCSLNDTYGPKPMRNMSIYDREKQLQKWKQEMRKKDYTYDILACLYPNYSEDFEDFCLEFGYSDDSIKAKDTYLAVRKETKNLKRLFDDKQLEKLCEIA